MIEINRKTNRKILRLVFCVIMNGNSQKISAGSNTLASYTYNANNGKLRKITYGNGFAIEYFYNELENISDELNHFMDKFEVKNDCKNH